ncbi:MAG: tRNA-dihydrouridine synthase family protein [Treponema sp.]
MKLICAPMATLSHEAFRLAIEKFGGCDEYFTEMINAPSLLNRGPFEKYYLLNGPVPEKIVWQLTGNKADSISKASAVVAELGGIGVDINMGCSAPQIYKTGAGIAWMLKPIAETEELIKSTKKSLDEVESKTGRHMRLSVKCRLGDDDFTDEKFFSFTDMLVENGVELITIHARTKKEKYRTLPKYEYVEKLALRYADKNIPITLNGDIKDFTSLSFALSKAPHCSGVMVARAAAQKPWIFAELKKNLENHSEEKTQQVDCQQLSLDFIDDVIKYQPEEFYKTRLQRFFAYYCLNFSFAHYFQIQMINSHSVEESKERVVDYFTKEPNDRFILF